jgi:hypothetical protein
VIFECLKNTQGTKTFGILEFMEILCFCIPIQIEPLKRKKIYYVPGMISLVLLPILLIYFSKNAKIIRYPKTFSIFLYNEKYAKKHPGYSRQYRDHFPPLRDYAIINLTGQKVEDEKRFAYAEKQIRKILAEKDTLNGVQFFFSKDSNFGEFTETLDILNVNRAKYYMITDNLIWFYYLSPDTTYRPILHTLELNISLFPRSLHD